MLDDDSTSDMADEQYRHAIDAKCQLSDTTRIIAAMLYVGLQIERVANAMNQESVG